MHGLMSSLCRINNVLEYLGSTATHAEERIGGVGEPEVPDEPINYEDEDSDGDEQPRGTVSEPHIISYAAGYGGRMDGCFVVLVDYLNHDQLIVNYEYDYGDSGGKHRSRIVCNKHHLSKQIKELWDALKEIAKNDATRTSTVIAIDQAIVQIRTTYLYRDTRDGIHWYKNAATLTTEFTPPAVTRQYNRQVLFACVNFVSSLGIFKSMSADILHDRLRVNNRNARLPSGPGVVTDPPQEHP